MDETVQDPATASVPMYDYRSLAFCKPTRKAPDFGWMVEPKVDGIRAITDVTDGKVTMWGRAGTQYQDKLPHIVPTLRSYDATIDGELVFFDKNTGNVDFHRGSGILRSDDAVGRQEKEGWLTYIIFDILRSDTYDLAGYSLSVRRHLLETLRSQFYYTSTKIWVVEQADASDVLAAENFLSKYREGLVYKRSLSVYPLGKRSSDWLKHKVVEDEDVVIMGYTPGFGKFSNTIGAVIFGQYQSDHLVERGQCSGMDDSTRRSFGEKELGMVMSIRHMGISSAGGFRHPQFARLRDDKPATDCVWTEGVTM